MLCGSWCDRAHVLLGCCERTPLVLLLLALAHSGGVQWETCVKTLLCGMLCAGTGAARLGALGLRRSGCVEWGMMGCKKVFEVVGLLFGSSPWKGCVHARSRGRDPVRER